MDLRRERKTDDGPIHDLLNFRRRHRERFGQHDGREKDEWRINDHLIDRRERIRVRERIRNCRDESDQREDHDQIGTLDLALVNKPPYSKDFAFKSFFDEDYVLYISSSHPLASKKSVTIAEMDQIDLIAPPKGIPFRDLLDTLAKRSNTEFNIIAEVDGVRLIASMAFDGYAPAIIPATAVPHYLSDFAVVPVEDFPNRRIGIAKRKRTPESAPMISVLALLDEIFSDEEPSRFPMPDGTRKIANPKA